MPGPRRANATPKNSNRMLLRTRVFRETRNEPSTKVTSVPAMGVHNPNIRADGVHLSYDSVASLSAPYGNRETRHRSPGIWIRKSKIAHNKLRLEQTSWSNRSAPETTENKFVDCQQPGSHPETCIEEIGALDSSQQHHVSSNSTSSSFRRLHHCCMSKQ
jgi:hypothetical protein